MPRVNLPEVHVGGGAWLALGLLSFGGGLLGSRWRQSKPQRRRLGSHRRKRRSEPPHSRPPSRRTPSAYGALHSGSSDNSDSHSWDEDDGDEDEDEDGTDDGLRAREEGKRRRHDSHRRSPPRKSRSKERARRGSPPRASHRSGGGDGGSDSEEFPPVIRAVRDSSWIRPTERDVYVRDRLPRPVQLPQPSTQTRTLRRTTETVEETCVREPETRPVEQAVVGTRVPPSEHAEAPPARSSRAPGLTVETAAAAAAVAAAGPPTDPTTSSAQHPALGSSATRASRQTALSLPLSSLHRDAATPECRASSGRLSRRTALLSLPLSTIEQWPTPAAAPSGRLRNNPFSARHLSARHPSARSLHGSNNATAREMREEDVEPVHVVACPPSARRMVERVHSFHSTRRPAANVTTSPFLPPTSGVAVGEAGEDNDGGGTRDDSSSADEAPVPPVAVQVAQEQTRFYI